MSTMKCKKRYITTWEKAPVVFDTEYAALLLGISKKTVQRMAKTGELPAFRVGCLWRFEKSALMAKVGIKERWES